MKNKSTSENLKTIITALDIEDLLQEDQDGTLIFSGKKSSMPVSVIQDVTINIDIHTDAESLMNPYLEFLISESASVIVAYSPVRSKHTLLVKRNDELLKKKYDIFSESCYWDQTAKCVVDNEGRLQFLYSTSNIIKLPESVHSLTKESVPLFGTEVLDLNNVESISRDVFFGTDVTTVIAPMVRQIDAGAFSGSMVTNLTLGPSLQTIEDGAFFNSLLTSDNIANLSQIPLSHSLWENPEDSN